jgi:hypothetical protein
MRIMAIVVVGMLIGGSALAQTGYSRGYSDGYDDAYPPRGLSDASSDYGRGFQAGQDDAADDDARDMRQFDEFERSLPTSLDGQQ